MVNIIVAIFCRYQEYYTFIGGYIQDAVICEDSGSNATIGMLLLIPKMPRLLRMDVLKVHS